VGDDVLRYCTITTVTCAARGDADPCGGGNSACEVTALGSDAHLA
jgi:hypothetical protein